MNRIESITTNNIVLHVIPAIPRVYVGHTRRKSTPPCPLNTFAAANVDDLLITDGDADVSAAVLAGNYSYPRGRPPFVHRPLLVFVDGRPSSLRCIALGGYPTPTLRIQISGGRSGHVDVDRTVYDDDDDDADTLKRTPSASSASQPSSSSLVMSAAGRQRWFSSYSAAAAGML